MSIQDPLSDMLTRIRNAQAVAKRDVSMPSSKAKVAVAEVLMNEGYIEEFKVTETEGKKTLTIVLKYFQGEPVISELKRVSKPGLRQYRNKHELPSVQGGLGTAIVSTSKGVMSDRQARALGQGGEVLCIVS